MNIFVEIGQGLAVIYLMYRQNVHLAEANRIMREHHGVAPPESNSRSKRIRFYWPLIAMGVLAIASWIPWLWHPPSEYRILPENEMQLVEGKPFINEPVDIDGKLFRRCTFMNVRFVFHGHANTSITNSQLLGPIVIASDNKQAKAMAGLVVTMLREGNLVDKEKVGFDNDGNVVMQGAVSTTPH